MVADAATQEKKRLVIVIDALDEDKSSERDKQSVIEMLPRHNISNTVIILSSRPEPNIQEIPYLSIDHPVKTCPTYTLKQLQLSKDFKKRATEELNALYKKNQKSVDIVALLAVSNGSLSISDLAELTGELPLVISRLFEESTGRIFLSVNSHQSPLVKNKDKRYMLGHADIQEQAMRDFVGKNVKRYMRILDAWCDNYKDNGWPVDTPLYLLTDYLGLLAGNCNWRGLGSILSDQAFISLLFEILLPNTIYLQHIKSVLQVLIEDEQPDLLLISMLSHQRERLKQYNSSIPNEMPVILARLGKFDFAISLSDSFTSNQTRFAQKGEIITILMENGLYEKAAHLALLAIDEVIKEPMLLHHDNGNFYACLKALYEFGWIEEARTTVQKAWAVSFGRDHMHMEFGRSDSKNFFDALVEFLDGDIAFNLAESASIEDSMQSRIFVQVAFAFAKNGDVEGTRKAVKKAFDTNIKNYSDVAGDALEALAIVGIPLTDEMVNLQAQETVNASGYLADHLTRIAKALINRGEIDAAKKKLGCAKEILLEKIAEGEKKEGTKDHMWRGKYIIL
jgi:tetratricopeptide (TPR) repeat protein